MSTQLQSRYIHISDYCLVEYIYSVNGQPTTTASFNLIENGHMNSHQIFNGNADIHKTLNVQDLTVVQIDNNKFVSIDQEKIPEYLDYDTALTVNTVYSGIFVYDTVRFHFVTGFNFEEFVGLVLTVKHKENNDTTNLFCNILASIDTADSLLMYNPRPIFLGDSQYDRYVEVKIPSIKKINTDYYNATGAARENTLAAKITPVRIPAGATSSGFIPDNPIIFSIDELTKVDPMITAQTTYETYLADGHHEAVLPQINEFELVGAFIQESTDGDYIEYYATYDSGFIEDFMGQLHLKNPHDKWIIAHQLVIYEQIGENFVASDTVLTYQDSNYDSPKLIRPILKNAGISTSFSIDYMIRLINQRNGDQIIRTAARSSFNCKKYGLHMAKIQMIADPKSHKIYNRLFKNKDEVTQLFIEPEMNPASRQPSSSVSGVAVKYVYIPTFFNFNRISLSQKNLAVSTNDPTTDLIYKQGDMHTILYPFTNILKFKIYDSNSNNNLVPMNLSASNQYFIVFMNSGRKTRFQNSGDTSIENLAVGELAFTLHQDDVELILKSKDREFYITTIGSDTNETVLYTGFWNTVTEKDDVDANIKKVKEAYKTDESTQATLNNLQNKAIEQTAAVAPAKPVDIPGYIGSVNKNEKSGLLKTIPYSEVK